MSNLEASLIPIHCCSREVSKTGYVLHRSSVVDTIIIYFKLWFCAFLGRFKWIPLPKMHQPHGITPQHTRAKYMTLEEVSSFEYLKIQVLTVRRYKQLNLFEKP